MGPEKEKIVLDLETKKSLSEVRDKDYSQLGVSVAVIYSYLEQGFHYFLEEKIKDIQPYLQRAELVIGFNITNFDFLVLEPYLDFDLTKLKILDIFTEVRNSLGFRLGLESLAQATLGTGKTGSGLDALKYFRQGEIKKLIAYCRNDVRVTCQLYEYGLKHNQLLFRRGAALETIPISWGQGQGIRQILDQGFKTRQTLEIEYSAAGSNYGRQSRQIDIYDFDLGKIVAYCHLRKDMRTFNLRRILSAKLTGKKYSIPPEFDLQAYKARQKF